MIVAACSLLIFLFGSRQNARIFFSMSSGGTLMSVIDRVVSGFLLRVLLFFFGSLPFLNFWALLFRR